jgi:Zn-dependent protease
VAAFFLSFQPSHNTRSLHDIDLLGVAIGFGVLLISLTIHEAAHAWTADRLGDRTARVLGRVSLNPLVHIDLIGTVLLPLIAAVSHLPLIGWAKPVPVNTRNLGHPRRDFMLVAAAGPISNLLQAIVAAVAMRVIDSAMHVANGPSLLADVLYLAVQINLLLAFFNLIPVPPLDGGNVLMGLLPPRVAASYYQLRQYGFLVLYAMMFTGVASAIVVPPTRMLMKILIPASILLP